MAGAGRFAPPRAACGGRTVTGEQEKAMADIRDLVRSGRPGRDRDRGRARIGRESAEMLAAAGARVALADLDKAAADAAAAAMRAAGLHAVAIGADVADERSVEAMVSATLEREGRLDILVNNAGVAIRRPAVELALADWDKVVAVNMTGAFLCARAAARPMIAAGAARSSTSPRSWASRAAASIPTSPIRRPRARSST